jgi:hypothetical protein
VNARRFAKPCKLEWNNTGAWKTLGRFDAADEEQSALVMDAAQDLALTLHNSESQVAAPKLRICVDDNLNLVIAHWSLEDGWRDRKTGGPI